MTRNLTNDVKWMTEQGLEQNNGQTNLTQSYKGLEVEESHDHPRLERKQQRRRRRNVPVQWHSYEKTDTIQVINTERGFFVKS